MNPQHEIIEILKARLAKSRSKNSTYSMRALAQKVNISPSAMSEILNGRRPITKNTGDKLLVGLQYPPDKKNEIISFLPKRYTKSAINSITWPIYTSTELVDMSQFNLIANWSYFAILSLSETKLFKSDPKWISKRLNIKIKETKKAIDTLVSLNLLKRGPTGQLKPTGKQYTTTTDISHQAIKKHHLQHLDILKNSLLRDPVHIRDFLTMTLTFDPAEMAKAKKMIDEFQEKFTKKMERTAKKEVYRLSVQFVPLSQEIKS